MRHGPVRWTEEVVARRIKEGFGQGSGPTYIPWLTVHDLASSGRQSRIPMRRYQRPIHTHSYIERALLLYLDYLGTYEDILDQWPLPRNVTMGAAAALNVRHPTYPVTRVPTVMTYDLLGIRRLADGSVEKQPYDCKMVKHLAKPRVQELLSIHRVAAEHMKMNRPHIFTEASLPRAVLRNIQWIRGNLLSPGESPEFHELLSSEPARMLKDIAESAPDRTISEYCASYDAKEKWRAGTALRVISSLLWSHTLKADLNSDLIPLQPVPCLGH